MRVYVLNFNKQPLTPCHPARAKKLLRQGKAKVYRRTPFTIKLTYLIENPKFKEMTIGIDSGSKVIGSAVTDDEGNVYYLGETYQRTDIKKKMDQRRMYRRTRRNRKTRYRQPRFLNRRNSIKNNRYPPTIRSKYDAHDREIRFIASILPVTKLRIETATFDPHALKDPSIIYHPWTYQKGTLFKYYNMKAYILDRDKYTCKYCKGKSKDSQLNVHHIIERSNGGSDNEANLITLCKTCHDKVHSGSIFLAKIGHRSQLNHATHMNILQNMLKRQLTFTETFGYISKVIREAFNLPKSHCYDALAASVTNQIKLRFKTTQCLIKKCVSKGDYQLTKGIRSEKSINVGKIKGFRKFDKVSYHNVECFIKGRMSTGYAILMNIFGSKLDFGHIPKMGLMKRISSRGSWIINPVTILNTSCCIIAS